MATAVGDQFNVMFSRMYDGTGAQTFWSDQQNLDLQTVCFFKTEDNFEQWRNSC